MIILRELLSSNSVSRHAIGKDSPILSNPIRAAMFIDSTDRSKSSFSPTVIIEVFSSEIRSES